MYLHWSVFAVVAVILAGVARRPVSALLGHVCYFSYWCCTQPHI